MEKVDARGLSCPEPVIAVRRALAGLPAGEDIEVLVETATSRDNVLRTAKSLGCTAGVEQAEEGFKLIIHKP